MGFYGGGGVINGEAPGTPGRGSAALPSPLMERREVFLQFGVDGLIDVLGLVQVFFGLWN